MLGENIHGVSHAFPQRLCPDLGIWIFTGTVFKFVCQSGNFFMVEIKNKGKIEDYVYDISLDGTVVNALGLNIVSNTDGFNFALPKKFRYTKEHPYIGKGLSRETKEGVEYIGYNNVWF